MDTSPQIKTKTWHMTGRLRILKSRTILLPLLIVIGLLIRISLTHSVSSTDAYGFVMWSKYLTTHSLSDLYQTLPEGYPPYTPGYYYVLKMIGNLVSFLKLWDNSWWVYLLIQFPVYLVDIGVAVLIYLVSKKWWGFKQSLLNSMFYYLNPAIIYVSAVLGQVDSTVTFLCLVALFGYYQKKQLLFLISYSFALLMKPQSLAIAPLYLLFTITEVKIRNIISSVPLLGGLLLAPIIPVILDKGVAWTSSYMLSLFNWYPYTSVYAYNLWAPLGFIVSDSMKLFGIFEYKFVGLCLFIIAAWSILKPLFKSENRTSKIYMFAAFLFWYAFFFFETRIHSRYLIYSLGFFAPFFARFTLFGIALSLVICANLLLPLNQMELIKLIHFLRNPLVVTLMCGTVFGLYLYAMRMYHHILDKKV